jgi:hypothetical protein
MVSSRTSAASALADASDDPGSSKYVRALARLQKSLYGAQTRVAGSMQSIELTSTRLLPAQQAR